MKKLTALFLAVILCSSMFKISFAAEEIIPTVTLADTNDLKWVVTNNTSLDSGYKPWYDHTATFSLEGFDNVATIQTKRYEPAGDPWKTLYKGNVSGRVETFTVNKSCEVYIFFGILPRNECGKWMIEDGYAEDGSVTNASGITLYKLKKSFIVPEGETLDIPIGCVNSNWFNQMCSFVVKWLEPEYPVSVEAQSEGSWMIKPNAQLGDKIYTDRDYYLKDYSTDDSKLDIKELGLDGCELIMTADADNSNPLCNSSSAEKLTWATVTLGHSADVYVISGADEDSQGRYMNWLSEEGFTKVTDSLGNPVKTYIQTTYNQAMFIHKKTVIIPDGETATVNFGKVGAWSNVMYFGLIDWLEIYDEPLDVTTNVSYSYDELNAQIVVNITAESELDADMAGAEVNITVKDGQDNEIIKKAFTLDGEGKFFGVLSIPYIPGEYKLSVEGLRIKIPFETTFNVSDVADIIILLDDIKNGVITDGSGIKTALDDENRNLKIDKTVYNLLDDAGKLNAANIYFGKLNLLTVEEFISVWPFVITEAGLSSRNKNAIAKVFELYEEETGVKALECYSDFNALSSKDAVWEELSGSVYTDSTAFETAFTKAVGMTTLKSVSFKTDITPVISKYSSVFGYDTTSSNYVLYEGYVTEYLLRNISFINTPSDLVSYINSGIAEAVMIYNANLPPVGGGGGGGGGGSSSRPKTEVEVSKDVAEELPEDIDYEAEISFRDIEESHWAYEAVKALSLKNVLKGDDKGNFKPEAYITRAEYTKIIVSALGITISSAEDVFSDVEKSDWYYEYISAAYKAGIIKGTGDSFNPDSPITRQDAFLILANAIKPEAGEETAFEDRADIAEYAKAAVDALYSKGLVSGYGDNTVKPLNKIKRAEAAQLIFNLLEAERLGE